MKFIEREGFTSHLDAADCNMVKKLQFSAMISRHLLSKDQASKSCVSFCMNRLLVKQMHDLQMFFVTHFHPNSYLMMSFVFLF